MWNESFQTTTARKRVKYNKEEDQTQTKPPRCYCVCCKSIISESKSYKAYLNVVKRSATSYSSCSRFKIVTLVECLKMLYSIDSLAKQGLPYVPVNPLWFPPFSPNAVFTQLWMFVQSSSNNFRKHSRQHLLHMVRSFCSSARIHVTRDCDLL